ncbi:unnamed protein product, partial [Nesidiocoris tenuis]
MFPFEHSMFQSTNRPMLLDQFGREPTLPPWRRPSRAVPSRATSRPAARHGSASRRRYGFENLRPARMFVRVIPCSAILLVRIACSRPQSSAVFPPGRSRRAR